MPEINEQIVNTSNDCTELDDTSVTLIIDDLIFGTTLAGAHYDCGLRWETVDIPQGAVINSAKLKVWIVSVRSNIDATIKGIDADDTPLWSSVDRPSQRTKTAATINADYANWTDFVNSKWASIDITSVIQEIIDRSGWEAGNSLGIVIETDEIVDSDCYIKSFDYSAAYSAKLEIEYAEENWTPVLVSIMK